MISFGFLMIPFILSIVLFVFILLTSCIWIILFYNQPNRAHIKYKSFYSRRQTNFFDDDDNSIESIHSKKFEQMKKIPLNS